MIIHFLSILLESVKKEIMLFQNSSSEIEPAAMMAGSLPRAVKRITNTHVGSRGQTCVIVYYWCIFVFLRLILFKIKQMIISIREILNYAPCRKISLPFMMFYMKTRQFSCMCLKCRFSVSRSPYLLSKTAQKVGQDISLLFENIRS